MPLTEFTALLVFATAMAFTPGPNTTLAAALAANHGLRHAMRFVLAVPFGWSLLLVASTLGLGTLLQAAPLLPGAIKWGGLAAMLWLAWRLARTTALATAAHRGLDIGFVQGMALQFVNIKAWITALMISAGWVVVGPSPGARLAVVLPVMMVFALASNLSYALLGAALRSWLAQGQRLSWFNRALALVLAGTTVWMARL